MESGANAVLNESDDASFLRLVRLVLNKGCSSGNLLLPSDSTATSKSSLNALFGCPLCPLGGFERDQLIEHSCLYHNGPSKSTEKVKCPLCSKMAMGGFRIVGHMRAHVESDAPPPSLYPYALVVCRRPSDGAFLLVHEWGNEGWWLPAGHAEANETLQVAAVREALEESGVNVVLRGLLRVEFSPVSADYCRLRAVFYAEPADPNAPCKSIPDYESLGATWVSASDITTLKLRGQEALQWSQYLARGGTIYPLSLLTQESTPLNLPSSPLGLLWGQQKEFGEAICLLQAVIVSEVQEGRASIQEQGQYKYFTLMFFLENVFDPTASPPSDFLAAPRAPC
ncbi:NUDIX hydrolase domain protein [Pelomyxa schiedti]|nr:NUDIX hydrolase domain protein [Pelomyxa schiedti]